VEVVTTTVKLSRTKNLKKPEVWYRSLTIGIAHLAFVLDINFVLCMSLCLSKISFNIHSAIRDGAKHIKIMCLRFTSFDTGGLNTLQDT